VNLKSYLPVFAVAVLSCPVFAQLPQHRDVSDLQPYQPQQQVSAQFASMATITFPR